MTPKQLLQALHKRFPTDDLIGHFVALHDGDLEIVLVKDEQFYPFAISDGDTELPESEFISLMESAAESIGILDIIDA